MSNAMNELARRVRHLETLELVPSSLIPVLPIAPTAQNDMIIADAIPAWSILTGPTAQYQRLESGATPFVPVWTGNLGMADDTYIGVPLGGRLIFDLTPAPDQVQITDADLNIATTAHGIIHVDGVVAGYILQADGTRYVPADPAATLPIPPVAQNDMIIADAVPAWSILTGPATQYERLESGAAPFIPAWTVNLGMADDAYIGIPAGGRLVFDSTPAPDQVQVADADLNIVTAAHGIIHVDGVAAGYILRADGTRYIPADPTTTLPLAPVAQGDMIIADATPAWSILTLGAAAGYALVSTAVTAVWSQTPTWTGLHTFGAGWLLSGGLADLDGIADSLVLDTDGDTTISAPTDDQIDVEIAGADDFTIAANAFNVLAGSAIVMADGTTIGQAAGPLLTFDDTLNYLEVTGCFVGLGTAVPGYQLHGYLSTNATQAFLIENPNAGAAAIAALIVTGDTGSGSFGFCSSGFAEAHRQDRAFVASEADAAGLDIMAIAAAGDIVFYTSGTDTTDRRGIIQADGDWGIKNVAPTRTLDVSGTIYAAGSDAAWTTAGWGRSIEMEQGDAILWKKAVAGVARGIGSSSNGIFYIIRSTANDASAAATYDVIVLTDGKTGIGVVPDTQLDVAGAITFRELSADPANPDEGSAVLWMSDGVGTGDDGDILMKITAGAVTKTTTLVDFSAI